MSIQPTFDINTSCKDNYLAVKNEVIQNDKELIISHFGHFSQDLITSLSEHVESMMISAAEPKQLIKKVFAVLIEGLQNVRVHSQLDGVGDDVGAFLFVKDKEIQGYELYFMSLIDLLQKQSIEERLLKLNTLEQDKLKEHYLEVLSNGQISARGNAGLGFITMRMKSLKPIDFKFIELEQEKFYFITKLVLENKKA